MFEGFPCPGFEGPCGEGTGISRRTVCATSCEHVCTSQVWLEVLQPLILLTQAKSSVPKREVEGSTANPAVTT